MPTNEEFLKTIFGDDYVWSHVTDFTYDPADIPKEEHLRAWSGNYFSRYRFGEVTNQYFTISAFYCDEAGKARRRKALYRYTPCIVLDDVKEKLLMSEVQKLPRPTWVLETSPGSEQWGYILDTPCADRSMVENLLDGLVANGLAPAGRDPGMKGVTRYVRLPEGYNNKASKMINGQPFKCRMLEWNPFERTTIESLAAPFSVDLHAARRESRVDGATDVSDHPLLSIPDIITVKEVRSDGRFDITCPWVDEHTGQDDSGSAVFTNGDGSIGFKCHHGACQERTGANLLRYIESVSQGFGMRLASWQALRVFNSIDEVTHEHTQYDFQGGVLGAERTTTRIDGGDFDFTGTGAEQSEDQEADQTDEVSQVTPLNDLIHQLNLQRPTSPEARTLAQSILKVVEQLPEIDRLEYHNQVCDLMSWNKSDFKNIIKDLRKQWYGDKAVDVELYSRFVFVKEINQFYDHTTRMLLSPEAFNNAYCHEDAEVRKVALQNGAVRKVDRLDFAPGEHPIFEYRGAVVGNTWRSGNVLRGRQGDVTPWLNHFETLGWGGPIRKHILQWMAYTMRHPERKINHILLLGSGEGCGKDFLLHPLTSAMQTNGTTISGHELVSDFNEYLLNTKYLNVNETDLGDHREAVVISNKLKPLAAAPPDELSINQKGVRPIHVRNIMNVSMTTNSKLPIRLSGMSRRFYALWSTLYTRDDTGNVMPQWLDYWDKMWTWMRNGGYEYCIHYLHNEVDLSDFNPGEAPPVTEFMQDIQEDSKSPIQLTIEAFIAKRIGPFQRDLLTIDDISTTMRFGNLVGDESMYADPKVFTPARINRVMSEIPSVSQQRMKKNAFERDRVWILRNTNMYSQLTPEELYKLYIHQRDTTVVTSKESNLRMIK